MKESRNESSITKFSTNLSARAGLNWVASLLLLALALSLSTARADDADDRYMRIFDVIQQGESLEKNGEANKALAKYREAAVALQALRKEFPDWNTKAVNYRMSYLTGKITAISQPPGAAGSSGAPGETKPAGGNGGGQVKLLEPGAEPRKELRLHPQAGDKQTVVVTVKTAVETALGEMEMPATKLPLMTMTMEMTVKSVSAGGDASYEMVVSDASVADDPGVTPQIAEVMKTALAGVKGLSVTGAVTSRGIYTDTSVKGPAGADAQTRQAVDQVKETITNLSTPLPEPAVGAGAKWEVGRKVKSQGMTIDQTITYEAVSIESQGVALKAVITQRAANQKVENPAMAGVKVDLTKLTGTGSGELTLDLGKLVAPASTMKSHAEMAMSVDMGGQKQAMKMKVDSDLKLEAK